MLNVNRWILQKPYSFTVPKQRESANDSNNEYINRETRR